MYGTPYWFPYPPMMGNREPTLRELIANSEELDNMKKKLTEEIEKKKKDKREKKPIAFSLLETVSLLCVAGFVAGPFIGYWYLTMLIDFIQKYAHIAPLLNK